MSDAALVFLCHSTGDKEQVRKLYKRLTADNIRCWFDEEDLLPGQDWDFTIREAMRASRYVVVCLSKAPITKTGYVQKELKRALDLADEQPEGSTFIIPVKLEECEVPRRLKRWHWVDLYSGRHGYKRLLRGLWPSDATAQHKPDSATKKRASLFPHVVLILSWEDDTELAAELADQLANYLGEYTFFIGAPHRATYETAERYKDRLDVYISKFTIAIVLVGPSWRFKDGRLAEMDESALMTIEAALTSRVETIVASLGHNELGRQALPPKIDSLSDKLHVHFKNDGTLDDETIVAVAKYIAQKEHWLEELSHKE